MNKILLFISFLFFSISIIAQNPDKLNSVEIYHKLEKLNFLGSALYFAAHPDDENTRLISYLSNELHARTAYLSLTRGDGGQNLIGTEIREKLGVIRTHELLGARKIDGGQQFFTRANDFGYSKHPDETLKIWQKDEVMKDIVKVIREFRPDIVINRFDHRSPGSTHGHHTSSAMLSVEAFDFAADSTNFINTHADLAPWQIRRVFFNTSWWFYGGLDKFDAADKSNLLSIDAGTYYPALGKSNNEIAALSRSMHKSQGFGATGSRGSQMEYLELVKGDLPTDKENLFEGINTSWSRVRDGAAIGEKIDILLESFDFNNPSKHVDDLLEIHADISKIEDPHWRSIKLEEIETIILTCSGIYLEAVASEAKIVPGTTITIDFEAINRSSQEVLLESVSVNKLPVSAPKDLAHNNVVKFEFSYEIPDEASFSNPYWLNEKGSLGMYAVNDENLIGKPEGNAMIQAHFELNINGTNIGVDKNVIYKFNDPVNGEVYEPIAILPKASVSFSDPVFIFADRNEKSVDVVVKSYIDTLSGLLKINFPKSWIVSPENQNVNLIGKGANQTFSFKVKGPYLQESAQLSIELETENDKISNEVSEIEHEHIPKQYLISPATTKLERINLKKEGDFIAYVQGAGDDVPQSLEQIGYRVDILQVDDLTTEKLINYDALIMGVRAYNTKPELNLKKDVLIQYMNDGGTVIVQYNTNRRVKGDIVAPYPMELSRTRVTDENARISFVDGTHEVLNIPNKISSRDFDNWVQERGLYFPNKWDERYMSPLACSDPNEPLTKGGLLIAKVGKGHYIYTGLSWFRQLPAGVPGAYRLFANLISIGNHGLNSVELNGINEEK